jgi:hypothetical protein
MSGINNQARDQVCAQVRAKVWDQVEAKLKEPA